MNESEFWKIINYVHESANGDMDEKSSLLTEKIKNLSKEDATKFSQIFDSKMDTTYSWELWGAAYILNGGCSDDSFNDFRSSLISRGKNSFEKAMNNPDSLADESFDEDSWFFEGFQYAVTEGVEVVLGSLPERQSPAPSEPSGNEWDEEDENHFQTTYPNLWKAAEARYASISPTPVSTSSESSKQTKKKPWWKFW